MRKKIGGKSHGIRPVTFIALTFLLLIMVGTILLMLPMTHKDGEFFPFVDAMFTATSAVCVTGLTVVDTFTEFNFIGQLVIILLIQLGGLGLMTVATLVFIFAGKKITLKERLILQEAYSQTDLSGLVRLTLKITKYAFSIEAVGALILSFSFIGEHGIFGGAWRGIFHAISAFCNAGFDLLGTGNSLVTAYDKPLILIPIMMLIVLGGIGFCVINDFLQKTTTSRHRLSLHSRVAIFMTVALLVTGTVAFAIFEWNNPKTIGTMTYPQRILSAMFQSVTPRTAGFNTVLQSDLTTQSTILTNTLMFIGASPSGTGGGIKTTTFFVIIATFIAGVRGNDDIVIFKHSIKHKNAIKAITILTMGLIIVFGVTGMVYYYEQRIGNLVAYGDVLFESFSAFGTVGLTRGITSSLSKFSLVIIALEMYLGRLGVLFLGLLAIGNKPLAIKYSEYRLIIG